jgi:hypothetical protein
MTYFWGRVQLSTILLLEDTKQSGNHLWHRYSITVNQVMVASVKLSEWWIQLQSSIVRHSMSVTLLQGLLLKYWSHDFKQQSHILLSGFKGSWFTHIPNHPHTHSSMHKEQHPRMTFNQPQSTIHNT